MARPTIVKRMTPEQERANDLLKRRNELLATRKQLQAVQDAGIEALKAAFAAQDAAGSMEIAEIEHQLVDIFQTNRKWWLYRPGKTLKLPEGDLSVRDVAPSVITEGVDTKEVARWAAKNRIVGAVRVVLELDQDGFKALSPRDQKRIHRKFPGLRVSKQEIIQVKGKGEARKKTLRQYLVPKPRATKQG